MKKDIIQIAIKSLLAGILIAIGATVYIFCLVAGHKIIGSLMFGFGLYTIIIMGLWLYTGKVGYTLENKKSYLLKLLLCFICNIIGVLSVTLILKFSGLITAAIVDTCMTMVIAKQTAIWYQILARSFMCGIMIYLAVEGGKQAETKGGFYGKALIIFLAVSIFILCGFDHVIANAAYYAYAGYFDFKTVLWFIIMFIGNGLGSIAINSLVNIIKK